MTQQRFPSRSSATYYQLPDYLQALIQAADALEEAMGNLDSAERRTRHYDLSEDEAERAEWRWHQAASSAAYDLYGQVREHAELAYQAWHREQMEQERREIAEYADEAHEAHGA